MDPKALMELSQLIQQLPPEQLSRMQTLMHNMMAGYDVSREMEEFERNLPAGFREKLMALAASQRGSFVPAPPASAGPADVSTEGAALDLREARLTILRGVASGKVSPEEAEKLLFFDPKA
jgi:hypothetical protein